MRDETAAQVVPFVRRVRVRNYRSIADCDMTLGPLTVLPGFNASGKSDSADRDRGAGNGASSRRGQRAV